MKINFSNINNSFNQSSTHPRDIFMALPNKSKAYAYPRDVQTEVWNQWFENKNEKNSIIKMNTGSGKTVVGLMILRSCLVDRVGPAVYVVPDNYLVNQVIDEASRLGIQVTKNEDDYLFKNGNAILVINIHKLVNGKSIFGLRTGGNNVPIGSLILDDVHACIDTINKQFTLSITKDDEAYNDIINILKSSVENYSKQLYSDIIQRNDPAINMMLPYWIWQDKCIDVYNLLKEKYSDADYVRFNLPLISSVFKICNCCISATSIEISPKAIDLSKISSFESARRRIYMSATLADDSVFVSTIGLKNKDITKVITPEKANDIGERLFLFPQSLNPMIDGNEIREKIKELSAKYNVSVLVNSFSKADLWSPYADRILSSRNENIEQGIYAIREGKGNGLTVFVNKYDGVDLPDDMCRILVIDDLPNLQSEYDKILYSFDPDNKQLLKRQIQKIEQGMGRGIRSNSDYCVVIFMGNKLSDTLITMQGKEYFSNATLAQFNLSEEIWTQILREDNAPSLEEIISLADYSLKRNEEWVNTCRGALSSVTYERRIIIDEVVSVLRNAFENAKCEQFKAAADEIDLFKNKVDGSSKGFLMQLVAEYTNFIDPLKAQDIQLSAKKINPSLLSPICGYQHSKLLNTSKQAEFIESFLSSNKIEKNRLLIKVNSILDGLSFNWVSAAVFEESLNKIANYIGYGSSRPEKENGEGPDNLWCLGNGHYLVIECKNCTTTNTICKSDCNQLNGSIQWFETEYKNNGFECTPIMIHNSNVFNNDCFPNENVRIITPKKLDELKQAIKSFVQAYVNSSCNDNKKIKELLWYYKLNPESIVGTYSVAFKKIN